MTIQNGVHTPRGSLCLEKVLGRLDKVKPAGSGKWKACCPAHNDKSPSLGIKETDDGKVLLHCWVGCTATDITAAIGLELKDLFPADGRLRVRRGPSRAAQQFEAMVITVAVDQMRLGKQLSAEDQERLELAKRRLGVA
ncbi:DNA primase [Stutzerimonas xanthomarina]|nr:DNA primase [Stutzerimonas xanthomarina]